MPWSHAFVIPCLWLIACAVPTPDEFCNARAQKECQPPDASVAACTATYQAEQARASAAGCDDEYASYAACLGGTLDEVTKCPDLGVEMDARLRGRCHSENRFLQRCLTGIDPDLVDAGADASGDAAP